MSTPTAPLNRFQRWYFGWAEKHYQRMPADIQAQARELDRLLYSRRGLGIWLGLLGGLMGSTFGLHGGGMGWGAAFGISLLGMFCLVIGLAGAWLHPEKFIGRWRFSRIFLWSLFGVAFGAAMGWLVGPFFRYGMDGLDHFPRAFSSLFKIGLPVALGVTIAYGLLLSMTAAVRRNMLQQELEASREAEAQAQAQREASEARLRLLQAQIQPHFIFNSLSAVQHWVDSADPRASGLLRSLTAFLRGSAELMLRPQVSLDEELTQVRHYLQVMQARWGERLQYSLDYESELAGRAQLPPGIVLSLVENALEHGLAPTLGGGQLRIALRPHEDGGWQLEVCDDGVGMADFAAEGLGLANCRARLGHAFGPRASLVLDADPDGRGTRACITLQGDVHGL
ncbi:histidine kinase [Pelomonas sp. SE-A7]|uniref:sensor histidine kinase n=1 Tax=Pelomonas sp. SE-A7 TaxID=3054953 RepID=UPI00259C6817|nr:histidine kinase [Pelomonas sp. SE-A7]MDM4766983.1 histidine kinase [Pelomonas sp. SE-A7]